MCDPQRMALLVYDMQVGICNQIKTANHIVAQKSAERCRGAGDGHARRLHAASVAVQGMDGDDGNFGQLWLGSGRRARQRGAGFCGAYSSGFQIVSET